MKLNINKKILSVLIFSYATLCFSSGYQQVIDKYTQALQAFINVDIKKSPNSPLDLSGSSLAFATYKKIITPYASYVNGWAHIASNSFAQHGQYLNHLKKTQQQLQLYKASVQNYIAYFPSGNSAALEQAFYELIGYDVVDSMFMIVQTLSDQAATESYDLQAAFIAYQLAHEIYQTGMNISLVSEGTDFNTALVTTMKNLYSNALMQLQNKLSIGNLGTDSIKDIYAQIVSYNGYLEQVYKNINDQVTAAIYKANKQKAAACYSKYKKAEKDYTALQVSLKNSPKPIALNVVDVTGTTNSLNSLIAQLNQNQVDARNTASLYQQAQDSFGAGKVANILDQIQINLLITDALAQLWLLYLDDQTGNSLYTAPSIAQFISSGNQNSANSVTNEQVISALQNFSELITQNSNSISSLSSNSQLAAYSIDQLIKLIQRNFLQLEQTGEKFSSKNNCLLVSIVSIHKSIKILFYIQQLMTALVQFLTQSDSKAVAYVYQYSKQLDTIYAGLKPAERQEINALIPYLPLQVRGVGLSNSQVQSWVNWSEQIILASGLVNTSDLATAQGQKVKIQHPAVVKPISAAQLSSVMDQAHQDALAQNFYKAAQGYNNLYQIYSNLYENDPTKIEYFKKMELIKTLYTASSFASKIEKLGTAQAWMQIKDIPQKYQITQYQFQNISITDLGANMTQLPASLGSIVVGSAYTTLTQKQSQDCIAIVKAYMICQRLLEKHAINFNDIYSDYILTQNPQVDFQALSKAQQVVEEVEIACNNFSGCTISSITFSDASTIQLMVCNNLVISRVTPLFSSMAAAVTFFASAQLLFAPSLKPIQLGSASYTQGNDQQLSDIMLENMVYAYLSSALVDWQKAKALMNQILTTLPKEQTVVQKLPNNFSANLNKVNTYITAAQSMLYATEQSAYAYSSKLKNSPLAGQVETIFFDTYKEFIAWMKQCLIGNPYQNSYRSLIKIISFAYTNWSAWLDPVKDAAQIAQNRADNIQLIQSAGDACLNASYTESLYPNYQQKHYAAGASYYQAAYKLYIKNSDVSLANALEGKILDAYFKGINQNMDIFLNYVLVNGVVYTSQTTGQQEQISFGQLMQDCPAGSCSSLGESKAYKSVKNLLLNAGFGLTFLLKKVQPTESAGETKKQQITSHAQTNLTKNVTAYLKGKGIMGANDVQPAYFDAGIAEKIYATNMDAYTVLNLSSNVNDYASWLNVIYSALQAIYAFHYLGATQTETGPEMSDQIRQFLDALSNCSNSKENNAWAYGE